MLNKEKKRKTRDSTDSEDENSPKHLAVNKTNGDCTQSKTVLKIQHFLSSVGFILFLIDFTSCSRCYIYD